MLHERLSNRLSLQLVVHREPSTISIYDLCFVASLPWEEQPGRVFD